MTEPVIRVLDFEATGLHDGAEVCEVGYVDFTPRTHEISTGATYLCRVDSMPPDTRAVHHIRLEELVGLPPYDRWCLYEDAARAGIYAFAAHTCSFEERFILGPIPMFCTHKAALRVWPEAPAHGVFALLYWLEDAGLVSYDRARAFPPHRALPDAYATAVLLSAMFAAGMTGNDLRQWTAEPRVLPRVPIGNWRGRRWDEPDLGFLNWIIGKRYSDMDPDIIWNAEREVERRAEEWRRNRATKEGSPI
ncbi:MAG: hypothetical protein ACJ8DZ_13870 [Allosphingosinicella sp.]